MSLSKKQEAMHWKLCAQIGVAGAGRDEARKAAYAAAGLPASHGVWGNREMDRWIAHVASIVKPDDADAQLRQVQMPERRREHTVRLLMAALGVGEVYCERIVERQTRGRAVTLDHMLEEDWKSLRHALKAEAKRRWPTVEVLRAAIFSAMGEGTLEPAAVQGAIAEALGVEPGAVPPVSRMPYDDAVLALGAVRRGDCGDCGLRIADCGLEEGAAW